MSDLHERNQPAPGRGQPAPVPEAELEDAATKALADALKSSFAIVRIVMVVLVIVFLASGVRIIGPQEKAIVLRFGKPVGAGEEALRGPGLQWAFPYPIDEVVPLPVNQIQTATSTAGWFATTPEQEMARVEPPAGPSLNPAVDGYTLTADGNIIHARATLRYRISDPLKYYFNFANASNAVQAALNNALLYASVRFKVDDALRHKVTGFKETILARVSQLVDEQKLGITLEPGDAVARPPRQVKNEFNAALVAEQERSKAINEAQGYAAKIVTEARGEATARVNAGETDRNRQVQAVAAEARYLSDQLPYYQRDPSLFMRRLQTETLQRVLTNAQEKYYLPDPAVGQAREIRLQLNRELPKPKPVETAPAEDKH